MGRDFAEPLLPSWDKVPEGRMRGHQARIAQGAPPSVAFGAIFPRKRERDAD